MKPLYIFATSDRPDPYINTLAYSIDHLQITEIHVVVISEHNYVDENQEDNLLASTVVSNINNQLRALTSGNYIKDWNNLASNSTVPLQNNSNIKIYERCLEAMNKSGTSWKVIPILRLDKTLEEYVSKSPCIIDVSALKKNLLVDVVTTLLSIKFADVYSFELKNKPTHDQQDLYHNLRAHDDYIFRDLASSDPVKKALKRIDKWSASSQENLSNSIKSKIIGQEGIKQFDENTSIVKQKSEFEELESQVEEIKKKKKNCDEEAAFRARVYSVIFYIAFASIVLSVFYFVFFVENPITKVFLSLFSIVLLGVGLTWSVINLKEWSPAKFPEQLFDKEKKRLYEKFGFDEDELNITLKQLAEVKKNLKKI